ncbi:MAG: thiamine pyrophosphate-dependent dehydrogenase E1 component subunit alpha [Mariniphaga sp.]|nr:thiamine pyrophosphate-dependent dehydrogenase E1 component subunit alpha [Mariniphaga sp.]
MTESKKKLDHYRTMLRIRLAEEGLVDKIIDGTVKTPSHLYSGQEAIATGLCANLTKEDIIFGNHRSHGHYLAKGGSLKEMFAEIFCKETGCSRGRGGSMHLISPENGVLGIVPIVAGTISLAVGSALASKIKKENTVTVSFFGDGATGEGVLYESMNFAALKKLPVIFACENNLYSTHLPLTEIRVNPNISESAVPFGIKSFQIDGNDVLEVFEVSKKAVETCRNGEGPVFIEFLTYRKRGHVGPDDNIQGTHTDIRPKQEIEAWLLKDPIDLQEKYFTDNKISTKEELKKIKNQVKNEVNEAIEFALSSNYPNPKELLEYVYK